jgi:CheY-like chemotaxis protein
MKDVVLVDSQTARVRVFREAIAVHQQRFRTLRERSSPQQAARRAATGKAGTPDDDIRLHVFPNRVEALKFLRHEPPYEWAPRPAVVFTDLYLDEGSGTTLVMQLKTDLDLRDIPAVVLCSRATPREVEQAWDAGSNAVVDLPDEVPGMLQRVADTLQFWLVEAAP